MPKRKRSDSFRSNKRAKPANLARNISRLINEGVPNPPSWSPTITVGITQRFVCSTIGGVSQRAISINDLFDLKFVAATPTTGYRLFAGCKVRRVKIWAANTSATASNTVQVEWENVSPTIGSNSRIVSDTAVGVTNVAYISARPPPGSFAEEWLGTGAGTVQVFTITCPEGAIVDVSYTVALRDDENASSVTRTVAAASVGALYTSYLDSDAGTPGLRPLGVLYL